MRRPHFGVLMGRSLFMPVYIFLSIFISCVLRISFPFYV